MSSDDIRAGQTVDIQEGAEIAPTTALSMPKAVALQYDQKEDAAPRVIASGRGVFAEQILAIAFEEGVKVREDADLVEILEKVDVDSPIPLEAFAAVAEILSYVYKANASMK